MQVNFNFSSERFSEEIAKIGSAKEIAATTGISEQSLSSLKRGKSEPSNSTLSKIQSVYPSFDPIYVLTGIRNVLTLNNKVNQLESELNEIRRREGVFMTAIEKLGKHDASKSLPVDNLLGMVLSTTLGRPF